MITDLTELKNRPWYPFYPQGIRRQLESYVLPEIPSFRLLESSARYFPNSTALIYEPENLIVNYRELLGLCERFASGLQNKLGVKKGDKIAVYARNYPEFVIALFGIAMTGAVYVACNPLLTSEEVEYQLKDSGAKLAVTSDDLLPVLEGIVEKKSTLLERVIVFIRDQELKPPLLGLEAKKNYDPPCVAYSDVFSDRPFIRPAINPKQDLTAIMYTSGTTGYPKGVMISHYNVVSSTIIYQTAYTGKFSEFDEAGFIRCTNDPKDLTAGLGISDSIRHRFGAGRTALDPHAGLPGTIALSGHGRHDHLSPACLQYGGDARHGQKMEDRLCRGGTSNDGPAAFFA